MRRRPPKPTLFPYTTLFRSNSRRSKFAWGINGLRWLRKLSSTKADCRRPAHGYHSESRSARSEEHTSELQSPYELVCRLLLEKKKGMHISLQADRGLSYTPS